MEPELCAPLTTLVADSPLLQIGLSFPDLRRRCLGRVAPIRLNHWTFCSKPTGSHPPHRFSKTRPAYILLREYSFCGILYLRGMGS